MAPEFGKPIHQLPLIPADVLKKHRVHEPFAPRFRSAARRLQAVQVAASALPDAWRETRLKADEESLADSIAHARRSPWFVPGSVSREIHTVRQ